MDAKEKEKRIKNIRLRATILKSLVLDLEKTGGIDMRPEMINFFIGSIGVSPRRRITMWIGENEILGEGKVKCSFTSDGTLLIFDSRAEFAKWATKDMVGYEVWAEPKWLFSTLREQEKTIAELERDNENMTRDCIRRVDEISYGERKEEEGEVSENAVRAIRMREDARQRKIGEE